MDREITPQELLQIIGELFVQTKLLRSELNRIRFELEKERETNGSGSNNGTPAAAEFLHASISGDVGG
jgi:hypothetical protein